MMRLITCLFVSLIGITLHAADWPQWRGPRRDGISAETGLLASWPKEGPRQLWALNGLGEGYSGVSVAAGRVYTQGQRGGRHYVHYVFASIAVT